MYKFSDEILECNGHKPLECGWGVTVSHLYDMALEHAKYSRECGFIHIFRLNESWFISLGHVQFGPEMSSHYIVMNSVLLRKRTNILPGVIVLLSQIKYSAQCTIFFWNTQHRCGLFICYGNLPFCCDVSLDVLS